MTAEEEQVILVDSDGRALVENGRIATLPKLTVHQKGIRHLAVSVFIFNQSGSMLLQQRAADKYHSAGKWSNACCTHPRIGETPFKAARRRLKEEMGLSVRIREVLSLTYRVEVGEGLIENEFDHVFCGCSGVDPQPAPAEVAAWKWVDLAALDQDMCKNPDDYSMWFRLIWPGLKKIAVDFNRRK